MKIAIKSEADSRMLVYPMLKVLSQLGTTALFTSNPYCSRLIEDELEGGFRNIVIVPVLDDNLRKAEEDDEMYEGKYDYTLYDNVGCIDYDYLICIVTNHITEHYIEELKLVIDEDNVHVIKFGKPAPKKSEKKEKTPKKPKKRKGEEESSVESEDGETTNTEVAKTMSIEDALKDDTMDSIADEDFNKWAIKKTESDILLEKIGTGKGAKWCKFIEMSQIEELEARHKFFKLDDAVLKEIYRIIGSHLGLEERMFIKAGRAPDDSKTIVQGVDVS